MRLLQLATAPDRLIDLHPNVTIVADLDEEGRRVLVETVQGLAFGAAPGRSGLLEAHGLLFDLSDEMLGLLDVSADGLRPVVVASDLPTVHPDPRARERASAERALVELEERWAHGEEEQQRRQLERESALADLEHARRNAHEAEAGAAERIRLIDELTAQLDQADERRRQLLEARERQEPEVFAAQARRREVEEATLAVRAQHQEAAIRCSELAGQLDQARQGLDPGSIDEASAASEELERVRAEVEAARTAESAHHDAVPDDDEPATEWLARVQARLEELEKRQAAFGPVEVMHVAEVLARLRSLMDGELVSSPAALDLADELAALEADLVATSGVGATTGDRAAARARLEDARHGLMEAEQAVRNPELDRDTVERLEVVHAEVLAAIERADGRFAGDRAVRRVQAARAAEQALLDELGFTSYSDYMMGYSLLNVDPRKEATLDAARAELTNAEDEWRRLEAETEAELARAERMERRRLLVEKAATLLGRHVGPGSAVDELRSLRVPAVVPPELVDELQQSLDDAGVAVGDEDLSRDELMLIAEAWLAESDESADREQDLRREMALLHEERSEALAAVEAAAARVATTDDPSRQEDLAARLERAEAEMERTDARRRRHQEAEAAIASIAAELEAAVDVERRTAEEAAGAETAVAEAVERAEQIAADLVRITEELERLDADEAEANEHLQSLTERESATPEDLAREVAEAEATFALADDRVRAAAAAQQSMAAERAEAQALLESLQGVAEPLDQRSVAEEIEWYLLARLAAQRAVCLGGSLPLLIDDALDALDHDQLEHVLGRLERMADAVQVIVLTDDPRAATWVLSAGEDRAAVVQPQPV